ncbi:enhancer of split m7 protein-like [Struthio camelus]|uniref:enhancer of split m7 protein-like n=1 Tax=Struthio camelus TaxID=8801 RepID=UPI003603C9BA
MEEAQERGQRGDPTQGTEPPRSLCRKSLKPLIEKRRRARINASLEQLRRLLQQTAEQQNTRALSRLEKAEILEMTVQQLARLKKPDIVSKNGQDFAAGYRHCLNAVSTFLSSVGSSLDQNTRSHILRQLETTTKPCFSPGSCSFGLAVFRTCLNYDTCRDSTNSQEAAGLSSSNAYFTVSTKFPPFAFPDTGDRSNCSPDMEALVSCHLKNRTLTLLGFSMGQVKAWMWGHSLPSAKPLCFPKGWST